LLTADPADTVQIPRSSTRRSQLQWAKLLAKVEPLEKFMRPYDFIGINFRPGSRVFEAQLRPTPDYPPVPVVLECAGIEIPGWGKQRPSVHRYMLWRWDRQRWEWVEIGRALSNCWDWAEVMGPLAMRAIDEQWPQTAPPDLYVSAGRLVAQIDKELLRFPREDRWKLLAMLYDEVASRTASWEPDEAVKKPLQRTSSRQRRKTSVPIRCDMLPLCGSATG